MQVGRQDMLEILNTFECVLNKYPNDRFNIHGKNRRL